MTDLPRLADCVHCGDPIRFVRMVDTGRAMPVNPRPSETGTVAARLATRNGAPTLLGFVITKHQRPGPLDRYRFTPHPATCEAMRAERQPTTPRPDDPALF